MKRDKSNITSEIIKHAIIAAWVIAIYYLLRFDRFNTGAKIVLAISMGAWLVAMIIGELLYYLDLIAEKKPRLRSWLCRHSCHTWKTTGNLPDYCIYCKAKRSKYNPPPDDLYDWFMY